MAGSPLAAAHPLLHQLRGIDAWWTLAPLLAGRLIDPGEVDAALGVLVAHDRAWQDDPSADCHEALRLTLRRALEVGVEAAFVACAAARRQILPAALQPSLVAMDTHAAQYLATGDGEALREAERAWIAIARQFDLERMPAAQRLSLLCDAALLHLTVFEATGDATALDHLIGVANVALKVCRHFEAFPPHCALHLEPRLQWLASRLGTAYEWRHRRRGDEQDLQDALALLGSVAKLTHPDSPDYPLVLKRLAVTLGYTGRDGIRQGVELLEDAVAREPVWAAERSQLLALQGRGLLSCYSEDQRHEDLERAVHVHRAGMKAAAPGLDQRKLACGLAEALLQRARSRPAAVTRGVTSSPEADRSEALAALGAAYDFDVEEATPAERWLTALRAMLPAAETRAVNGLTLELLVTLAGERAAETAETLTHLARTYEQFLQDRTAARDLDLIVRLLQTADALDDDATPLAAARWNHLAVTLAQRYLRDGRRRDLGEALEHAHRAWLAVSEAGPARAAHANTLGHLRHLRFEILGVIGDLQDAIAALELAERDVRTVWGALEPGERAGILGNLGNLLHQRLQLFGEPDDEKRARALLNEAVGLARPVGGEDLARALSNLAAFHLERWRSAGAADDLQAAIDTARQALATGPQPVMRMNLGSALLSRYQTEGRRTDLDDAIAELDSSLEGLDGFSADRPVAAARLAEALHQRSAAPGDEQDSTLATAWSRASIEYAAGISAQTRFRNAWDWGQRESSRKDWPLAAEAFSHALDALRQLVALNLWPQEKSLWLAEAFGLPTRAAYALARSGDAAGAVVALEAGRGLLLSESLELRERHLEALARGAYAERYQAYRDAAEHWRALTRWSSAGVAAPDPPSIEAARHAWLKAIDDLEQVPGFENFFAAPSFEAVRAVALPPLLYLVPGTDEGVALIVRQTEPEAEVIPLPLLSEHALAQQASALVDGFLESEDHTERWRSILEAVAGWLGDMLAPALEGLTDSRLILIPTGALAYLPLHAAWVRDRAGRAGRRYLIDERVIGYAPTALTFGAARQRPSAAEPARSYLGVGDPRPSSLPPLRFATNELAAAARAFEASDCCDGGDATLARVCDALPGQHVVHFACHAESRLHHPQSSAVLLAYDEALTVARLQTLDLSSVKLAVLSACETGVPGASAPDEVIGIATACFGAGVDGVIASLWPVDDLSTLVMITRFFELWHREAANDGALALSLAQRWVKNTTNAEKLAHWRERWQRGGLAEGLYRTLETELAALTPGSRDFESPDDWAAFSYLGA